MFKKVNEGFSPKYMVARAGESILKVGGCLLAPKSSSQIFTHEKSDEFSSVIDEMLGEDHPRVGCVVKVAAKDVADLGAWLHEIDVVEDIIEFANSIIPGSEEEKKDVNPDASEGTVDNELVSHTSNTTPYIDNVVE